MVSNQIKYSNKELSLSLSEYRLSSRSSTKFRISVCSKYTQINLVAELQIHEVHVRCQRTTGSQDPT